MPCDAYAIRGGFAYVCTRGQPRAQTCGEPGCGFAMVALCDHDLGRGTGDDRFCSKPLCAKHAALAGKDLHFCFDHARLRPRAEIWTARRNYRGADALLITRYRGSEEGMPFAPSPGILRPVLEARSRSPEEEEAAWPAYVEAYRKEMQVSYRTMRGAWEGVLARKEVTLLCFCQNPDRCHRSLLTSFLAKLGGQVRGERPPEPEAQGRLFDLEGEGP